jgi:5-methylcytosine-specific restriction endonuclease McrA
MTYFAYLRSWCWFWRRKRALHRAGYRCERCRGGEHLDVHHRTYERLGRELDEDLEVLCRDCHAHEHGKENPREERRRGARLVGSVLRQHPTLGGLVA